MSLEINKTTEGKEVSVQDKLKMLYELQTVVSEIDKINTLRGELPLEVQDLEDEIVGLKTRLSNLQDEIKNLNTAVTNKKRRSKIPKPRSTITKSSRRTFETTANLILFPKRWSSRTSRLSWLKKGSKSIQ